MSNNLSVKVTADIVDLEAKLSIAESRSRSYGNELRDLAKQAANADEAQREKLNPALLQAAEDFAKAKAEASGYRAEIRRLRDEGPQQHGIEGVEALHAGLEKLAAPVQALSGLGEAFGAAFGIEQAVEKVSELVEKFGELGEQMSRAMETTGLTAEQLSGLRVVAAENGLEFDSLNRVMTKFASNIDEAGKGSLKQQAAFAALGINAEDLRKHGNDLNFMLELVAKRLDQYEAGGRKADIITAIFGSKIQGLAPILKDIAENGMPALQRHAAELGGLLGKDFVEEADKTHKSLADFSQASDNLDASLGNFLHATGVTDFFTHLAGAAANTNNELAKAPGFMGEIKRLAQLPGSLQWIIRVAFQDANGNEINKPSDAVAAAGPARGVIVRNGVAPPLPPAQPAQGEGGEGKSGAEGAKPQAPEMFDASGAIAKMHSQLEQIAATWDGTQSNMLAKQRAVVDEEIAQFDRQFGKGVESSKEYQSLVQEDGRLAVQIKRSTGQEIVEATRTQNAQISASWDGSQSGMLAKQRAVVDQGIAEFRRQFGAGAESSKEYQSLVEEDGRLALQIRRSAGEETIAVTRTQNATINGDYRLTATERLQEQVKNWQALLDADRVSGSQRIQVEREVAQATAALNREIFTENRAIKVSDANTEVALARLAFEQKKQTYEEDFEAHRISAARKEEVLESLTRDEYKLAQAAVDAEMVGLHEGTAAYEQATNKKRELEAELQRDLANLQRQGTQDARKEAQEQMKAWEHAVGEIESAESGMLSDLLAKRSSFSQAALRMVGRLVDEEIINDVRAMTSRLLIQDRELAIQKSTEQGGLLYHHFVEGEKTTTTAAHSATRQAINTKENTNIFGLIAGAVSRWFGKESAQTGATAAGAGQRTATQATADATSIAQTITTGAAIIQAYAAEAAAAAGASVAAIPYVGWAMVPETMATTYGEVLAYIGGLEVGAWDIPGTMVATLHQGEAVVPRDFASGLRASGSLAGGGGGDTFGDTNITNHFHKPVVSTDAIMAHIDRAMRNGHPAALKMRRR